MAEFLAVQGVPLLACLTMLSVLGYVGIHVLKREIIFIDIALAQIAAVGAIAAHVIFGVHGDSPTAQLMAFGSTLVAAIFFALARRRVREIPLEAIIGVSYAIAAAGALFLVGIAAGGHTHIQSMLAGSILWATWHGVLWSAGILAVVGLCFYLFRAQFHTISDDYEGATARGFNTLGWDIFFYTLVGIVITTVVRIGGVVVVFSFLIIPAATSSLLAQGWTRRLLAAWAIGSGTTVVGLLFANRYDFSVGPAISLWLGLALICVGVLRRIGVSRRLTAGLALVLGIVAAVWLGGMGTGADSF